MALGIYKPGHGYWVRVFTAVGAGLLVLATAAWLWGESAALNLPVKAWDVHVSDANGALTPGQSVTVLGEPVEVTSLDQGLVPIGTMVVESYQPGERVTVARLVEPQLDDGRVPSDMQGVEGGGFDATVSGVFPIPIVELLYVQGAVAGISLLVGAVLVFYFVGSKPSSSEFLIATDGEMKKVNWSTRREVLGSTWVVIAASVMIAAVLYGVDTVFSEFFHAINVLQR